MSTSDRKSREARAARSQGRRPIPVILGDPGWANVGAAGFAESSEAQLAQMGGDTPALLSTARVRTRTVLSANRALFDGLAVRLVQSETIEGATPDAFLAQVGPVGTGVAAAR